MKTLAQQLESVRRELGVRRKIYPGWIQTSKITRERAAHELDCFESAAATLQKMLHLAEVSEEILADGSSFGKEGTYDTRPEPQQVKPAEAAPSVNPVGAVLNNVAQHEKQNTQTQKTMLLS